MDNLHSEQKNKVHEVLVALQKSLSRVSRASADKKKGDAYALITGDVNFSFTLKCDLEDGHNLTLHKDGAIELHLDGSIATDIDVQDVLADSGSQDTQNANPGTTEKDNNNPATSASAEETLYTDLHKLSPEKLNATLEKIESELEKKPAGLKSTAINALLNALINIIKNNALSPAGAPAAAETQAIKPIKRKTSRK